MGSKSFIAKRSVIRHEAAGKLHVTKMRKRAAFEIEEA
jgi:hypothetical protein